MPSKYGFETADEKQKREEELYRIADRWNNIVLDILKDYAKGQTAPEPQRSGTRWVCNSSRVPTIDLTFDENRQMFFHIYDIPYKGEPDAEKIGQILTRKTGIPAKVYYRY